MTRLTRFFSIAAAVLAVAGASAQTTYTVQEVASPDYATSRAMDINDSGYIIGTVANTTFLPGYAFVYFQGQLTLIHSSASSRESANCFAVLGTVSLVSSACVSSRTYVRKRSSNVIAPSLAAADTAFPPFDQSFAGRDYLHRSAIVTDTPVGRNGNRCDACNTIHPYDRLDGNRVVEDRSGQDTSIGVRRRIRDNRTLPSSPGKSRNGARPIVIE